MVDTKQLVNGTLDSAATLLRADRVNLLLLRDRLMTQRGELILQIQANADAITNLDNDLAALLAARIP
jgi:hypothetical protein